MNAHEDCLRRINRLAFENGQLRFYLREAITSMAHAEVIGFHWGSDIADVRDCQYQPTRFSKPNLYTSGNTYYAATKGPRPKHDYPWQEVPDACVNAEGWKIWKATV